MENNALLPLVSIVIPSYNSSRYLFEAVNSIICQTYTNIEIILVDDGSTDDTIEIVKNLQALTQNLTYIKKTNGGIGSALNAGIKEAKGAYIGRMDADDISIKTRISEQVDFLEKHKQFDLVSSSYLSFFNKSDEVLEINHPSDPKIIKLLLCYCSPICHPAVFARASVLKNFEYSSLIASEDHDLWCKISKSHAITNIGLPLLFYRRHKNSLLKKRIWSIRRDTLASGFKHFIFHMDTLSGITIKSIYENQLLFTKINWVPAYMYLMLAKIGSLFKMVR